MVVCDDMVVPAPVDLVELVRSHWAHIAAPGSFWSAQERVAIAAAARTQPDEPVVTGVLPDVAGEAAHTIGSSPQSIREPMVSKVVAEIGELRYVELVGVASSVKALDTTTTMLGCGLDPLPTPRPGEPVGAPRPLRLKRRSSWVSMTGPPVPRNALTAVPATQAAMDRLLDRLYVERSEVQKNAPVRGLSREQAEVVVLTVSVANECFY